MKNDFITSTEELELEIIEFCINILGFSLEQFWYEWYTSSNKNNATLHINCCSIGLKDFVINNVYKLSFIDKVIKITELSTTEDLPIKYIIHFKIKSHI